MIHPPMSPPRARPRSIPFVLLAVGLCALVLGGCPGETDDSPPELVAEDVGSKIEISPEDDVREVRRPQNQLSGVLPSDFPDDLPLHLPASLVDFGSESAPYVELLAQGSKSAIVADLTGRLRAGGWSLEGGGDAWTARRDGRVVKLTVRGGGSGATYRYEY